MYASSSSGFAAGIAHIRGQIAHVLSGIAGGVAARKAISKYRQRQAQQQQNVEEMQPLLGGQRVGGSGSGHSNLIPGVNDENFVPLKLKQLNKVDHDLIRRQQEKFERNLSQIEENVDGTFARLPVRQPQETILDKVKKISARKANSCWE